MSYYAVARGVKTGVFESWSKIEPLVKGYPNAAYKKFKTYEQAEAFIKLHQHGHRSSTSKITKPTKSLTKRPIDTRVLKKVISDIQVPIYTTSCEYLVKFAENRPFPVDREVVESVAKLQKNSKIVEVYCDGGSRRNGSALASAGYGVFFNDKQVELYNASVSLLDIRGFHKKYTNQYAELFAILHTLGAIYDIYRTKVDSRAWDFIIKTDSQFSINCLTKWYKSWLKNGWKKSNGEPVEHAEIIKCCLDILDKFPSITFEHVRGHSGDYGNDIADKLANLGCDRMEGGKK